MSDYPVQRLRLIGAKLRSEIANERTVAEDAADEILRLRAENEKLRKELRDADEMLLNQARTIRDYQAAAIVKIGDM